MSGNVSNCKLTTTEFRHAKTSAREYGRLKGEAETVGQRIIETRSALLEAQKGMAETAVTMNVCQANLETLEKTESTAKENLKIAAKKTIANNETRAKIKENSAAGIIKSKTSLVQIQTALKKMPGSEVLLTKTGTLISLTDSLGKTNAEGGDVIQALIDLQASIKELVFGVQALAKTNAAAKK